MPRKSEPVVAEEHVATSGSFELSAKQEYPGQTMGIVALVLSFFVQIAGLILGIIAWVWSNKAGVSNVPAKVAVAVSAVLMVLGLIAIIGWFVLVASALGGLADFDGMGPGGRWS